MLAPALSILTGVNFQANHPQQQLYQSPIGASVHLCTACVWLLYMHASSPLNSFTNIHVVYVNVNSSGVAESGRCIFLIYYNDVMRKPPQMNNTVSLPSVILHCVNIQFIYAIVWCISYFAHAYFPLILLLCQSQSVQ